LQSGFTALHIASHYGNAAAAKVLINGGANVNFPGKVPQSQIVISIVNQFHVYTMFCSSVVRRQRNKVYKLVLAPAS